MHTAVKKLLALALCTVMVLGIFAACGKKPVETTPTFNYEEKTPGVIVLNTGAILSIRYDAQGNVDNITGDNDFGLGIMEEYKNFEGKPVTDAIKDLVTLSVQKEALTEDISTVMIKLVSGTVFEGDGRDSLIAALQEALSSVGSKAVPMIIDEENLTGEGYLTLATVKTLVMHKLGVEAFDAFYGDTVPINNNYLLTVEVDGVEYSYVVDAYFGFISVASQDDLLGDTEETFEEDVIEDVPEASDDYTEDVPADDPVEEQEGDIEIPIEDF